MQHLPPAQRVELKIGAQVLLLANLDLGAGLVNGSRGVVVDFVPDSKELEGDYGEIKLDVGKKGTKSRQESWKEALPKEFMELQKVKMLPIVMFVSGATSVCFLNPTLSPGADEHCRGCEASRLGD